MTILLNGILQGALLTAAVWLLLKFLPRLNAATRYTVWWIALLFVAVLPLRQPLIGGIPQHARSAAVLVAKPEALPSPPVGAGYPLHPAFPAIEPAPAAPLSRGDGVTISPRIASDTLFPIRLASRPVSQVMIVLWALASAVLLNRLVISYRSMQRLKTRATPAPQRLQERLNVLRAKAGVGRNARLLVCDDVSAPMALGLFDPVILIPRSLPQQMSELDFDHVALHELAHLRRYDDWINLLQKLLEALLPIQPALFWIDRQLSLERETACDDWVIAATGTAKPYATSLTRIAELTLWARCGILASGAAGHRSQLFRRVQRLLDKRRNVAPRVSTLPLVLAMTAVIALAWMVLSTPQIVALANTPAGAATPAAAADAAPSSPGPASLAGDVQPATQPDDPGTQIRSFPVQPGDKLVMDVDQGNIHVSTWDQNSVRVLVTEKHSDLAEFLEHHPITMTQQGHEVHIRETGDGSASAAQIEYQITVPVKFDAQLKDAAGNAYVVNLHGAVEARIAAGNIDAQQCMGRVEATSAAGNIDLREVDGEAKCDCAAGNIVAIACHGTLHLKAAAGNVDINKTDAFVDASAAHGNINAMDCTGALQVFGGDGNIDIHRFTGPSLNAKTATGNVSAEFLHAPQADSSLMSVNGNVQVKLVPGAVVNLLALTIMGNVNSEFPLGANQGGGPSLRMVTHSGNVLITKWLGPSELEGMRKKGN